MRSCRIWGRQGWGGGRWGKQGEGSGAQQLHTHTRRHARTHAHCRGIHLEMPISFEAEKQVNCLETIVSLKVLFLNHAS